MKRPCSTIPARLSSAPAMDSGSSIGPKLAVEDQIAAVRPKRAAVGPGPHLYRCAQPFDILRVGAQTEGDHLHRQGPLHPQPFGELARVNDDYRARAGLGDNLLAQQRAAPAFDNA